MRVFIKWVSHPKSFPDNQKLGWKRKIPFFKSSFRCNRITAMCQIWSFQWYNWNLLHIVHLTTRLQEITSSKRKRTKNKMDQTALNKIEYICNMVTKRKEWMRFPHFHPMIHWSRKSRHFFWRCLCCCRTRMCRQTILYSHKEDIWERKKKETSTNSWETSIMENSKSEETILSIDSQYFSTSYL